MQLEENAHTGQRWFDAEIQRVRGELLLRRERADVGMAEAAFTRAVKIAQHQQTWTFELRAALALARLYQATDRSEAGRSLLRPVAARFKEEPSLPEVAEAYRLLR